MDFQRLVKNIQKLKDVDEEMCTKLRAYVYDLVGACQEVHKDIGPFVNELTYQDALLVELNRRGYVGEDVIKEYYFTVEYKGVKLQHPHKVDFFVTKKKVYIECKAIEALGPEQRQRLWNYMRLTGIRIGILYNFAPFHDQCERYYLDPEKQVIYAF